MFAPTKVWRRWHRKVNVNQRRFAVSSALAASAVPALVQARGHRVSEVLEVPLIAESKIESVKTTKEAINVLKQLGAYDDVLRAKNSRKIRAGVGKLRNRRYVQRRGPLLVLSKTCDASKAFRNLPGQSPVSLIRIG